MTWSKNKNSTANISTVIIHSVNYLPSLWPTVNLGKHLNLISFPDLLLTKPSRNEITLQSTDYLSASRLLTDLWTARAMYDFQEQCQTVFRAIRSDQFLRRVFVLDIRSLQGFGKF